MLIPLLGPAPTHAGSQQVVSAQPHWSVPKAQPGAQRVLAIVINIADHYHINADASRIAPALSFLIPTELTLTTPPPWLTLGPVQYPATKPIIVNYTGQPSTIQAYEGRITLYLPIMIAADAPLGDHVLNVSLQVQSCDDKVCLPPATLKPAVTLTVIAPGDNVGQPDTPKTFTSFDPSVFAAMASGQTSTVTSQTVRFDLFAHTFSIEVVGITGLAVFLLIAALGGALLNFTPCVLPIVPIKIISLSRAAQNRSRCLLLGAAMSLGVIIFWVALGLVIVTVSEVSATNQLFQYPAFTLGIGIIIAVMAVGMGGLFTVRLPQFVYNINPKHDTLSGSLLFGIMTAILSTPCTAPFMGAAAAWAATQNTATALLTFAAIGSGMALPYLILSASPKLVEKMPRVGPASQLIKQVMGMLMLAAAAYFIGIGITSLNTTPAASPSQTYWWFVAAPIVAAGTWLTIRTALITKSPIKKVTFITLGLLIITLGSLTAYAMTRKPPVAWQPYTPQAFDHARQQNQIIVIDFTADWCLNCKALEHAVLHTPPVAALLNSPDVTPMKVDLTAPTNEVGKQKLRQTGRVAIPLLVIYDTLGNEVFKSDFYTIQQVVDTIETARGKSDD